MKKNDFTSPFLCLVLSLAIYFHANANPIIAVDEIVSLIAPCSLPSGDGTFHDADWVETVVFPIPVSGITDMKYIQISDEANPGLAYARFLLWADSDEILHFQEKATGTYTTGTRDPEETDGMFDAISYEDFLYITAEVNGGYINCYITFKTDARIKSCEPEPGFMINPDNNQTATPLMYRKTEKSMRSGEQTLQNPNIAPAPFSIIPNPAPGEAQLVYTVPENTLVTIYLYNSLGRLIKQIDGAGPNGFRLDMELFPDGVYSVVIQTKELRLINKLLKQ